MPEYKITLTQTGHREGVVLLTADNEFASIDGALAQGADIAWRPLHEDVTEVERVELSVLDGVPERKPHFEPSDPGDMYLYTARTADGKPLDVYVREDAEMILVVSADDVDPFGFDGLDSGGYKETYADDPFVVEVAEAAKESYVRGDFGTPKLHDLHLGTYCVTTRDRSNAATNVSVVRAHSSEEAVEQVPENLRYGVVTVERVWTAQDRDDFDRLKWKTESELSYFNRK